MFSKSSPGATGVQLDQKKKKMKNWYTFIYLFVFCTSCSTKTVNLTKTNMASTIHGQHFFLVLKEKECQLVNSHSSCSRSRSSGRQRKRHMLGTGVKYLKQPPKNSISPPPNREKKRKTGLATCMLASSEENKSCCEHEEEEHLASPATAPKLASREKERRASSAEVKQEHISRGRRSKTATIYGYSTVTTHQLISHALSARDMNSSLPSSHHASHVQSKDEEGKEAAKLLHNVKQYVKVHSQLAELELNSISKMIISTSNGEWRWPFSLPALDLNRQQHKFGMPASNEQLFLYNQPVTREYFNMGQFVHSLSSLNAFNIKALYQLQNFGFPGFDEQLILSVQPLIIKYELYTYSPSSLSALNINKQLHNSGIPSNDEQLIMSVQPVTKEHLIMDQCPKSQLVWCQLTQNNSTQPIQPIIEICIYLTFLSKQESTLGGTTGSLAALHNAFSSVSSYTYNLKKIMSTILHQYVVVPAKDHSVAVTSEAHSMAVVPDNHSVAVTSKAHSVAVAPNNHSLAVNSEAHSMAVVPDNHSLAVTSKAHSVAVAPDNHSLAVNSEAHSMAVAPENHSLAVTSEAHSVAVALDNHSVAEAPDNRSVEVLQRCKAVKKAHSCELRMASLCAAAGMAHSCLAAEMTCSCIATRMASIRVVAWMTHTKAVVFNLLKAVTATEHQGMAPNKIAPRWTLRKVDPEKKSEDNNALIFQLKTN